MWAKNKWIRKTLIGRGMNEIINGLAIRNDVDLMSAIVIAYLFGHITGVYSNLHSRILPIFESYINQIWNRKYYILWLKTRVKMLFGEHILIGTMKLIFFA